jgi:predicted Zn-dependent protease
MLLSEKEAKAICEKVLGYVKADDAQVGAGSSVSSHLRFGANSFRTAGRREDLNIGVTVWVEGRRGAASTNETDDAALEACVRQAEELARISPVDREYLPTLGPQQYKPVEGGYVEATANVSPAGRAKAISDILALAEKEKVIAAGLHNASGSAGASLTKNGNFQFERSSLVSLGMTARTPEADASGFFLRNHHDVARLDTARVAREAIGKAQRARGAQPVEPGAWTVILEPQAVADLLGFTFGFAFNARAADEGRSPFSAPGGKTRVGERIFDERINAYSDPWHPELPGSASAQGGIPAQKIYLVRNGVLETLIYNRFWAKQKEKEPTPGPVNTIIESAEKPATLEEMIADTRKGLLVSRFWYIRPVDARTMLITGLTRDGMWLIEDGKIARPASNLRFNQSILQMLSPGNVDAIGAPERVGSSEAQGRASALLPALKIKAFNFTSQSEAV